MATFYIPNGSYWSSYNYKMRLKVVQNYNSATNQSVLTVTPQFSGTAGELQALVSGTIQYSVGSSSSKTTLWDFTETAGGYYPYGAYFSDSWTDLSRRVSDTSWKTSKSFTVSHGGDGNVSVTFYANGVQSTGSNGITGNSAYVFQGTPQTYTLTISAGTGTTITVKRGSTTLSNGATLSYGDTLVISFGSQTAYNLSTHTVNGTTFTSGNSYTVTGNVTVKATATVKQWELYVSSANITTTVNRTSSPYKGASTGNLATGAAIYYGDVLTVTSTANTGYHIRAFYINGQQKTNPYTLTVGVDHNNVNVVVYADVNSYTLTLSTGTGATASVSRTSSPNKGAGTGTLSSGATIYYGDVLKVTAGASTNYQLQTFTINGTSKTSPATVTVTSGVSVSVTAIPNGTAQIGTGFDNYTPYIRGSSSYEMYRPYIWDNGSWKEY